mgnify:FL=1
MAEETITVLRLRTTGAEAVKDLKQNIKDLKSALEETTIGTKEYQETLDLLKVNQNALKDAMYATTGTMDDVKASAMGVGESYNALVHRMAALKEEFRSVDVSTEEGAQRFQELAGQISEVNDKLKDMDAAIGNYQRNVGNYKSHWDGMPKSLMSAVDASSKLVPSLGKVKNGVEGVDKASKLMATNPVMGIAVMLLPVVQGIVSALQDNEKALGAVKKLASAFQPVMEFFKKILGNVADVLVSIVDWVIKLADRWSGTIKTIVAGAAGVGNVLLQYFLTPIRSIVEAFKGLGSMVKDVFSGNWEGVKKTAQETAQGIGEAFKKGFSIKANYQAGREAADEFMEGLGNSAKSSGGGGGVSAKETGKEVAETFLDGFGEEIERWMEEYFGKEFAKELEDLDKEITQFLAQDMAERKGLIKDNADFALAQSERTAKQQLAWNDILTEDEEEKARKSYEIQADANQRKLDILRQYAEESIDAGDANGYLAYLQEIADLEVEIEQNKAREEKRIQDKALKDREANAKRQMSIAQSSVGAISSILGSLAQLYESDEANAEKNANKIKGLKISEATINTISGAITAFMQAQQLGPIAGPIVGAINAAAVTAAGIAQIAQLKSTPIGGSASSSISSPAMASAPQMSNDLPQYRQVSSSSEEQRLNQMANPQRVYILQSDIEASSSASKAKVAETSF